MTVSRRELITGLGSAAACVSATAATSKSTSAPSAPSEPSTPSAPLSSARSSAPIPLPASLPDRRNFRFQGVYLDAAFVHPFGLWPHASASAYAEDRLRDPSSVGPGHNSRSAAVARFARLIHASPEDIAVVPSTLVGENSVVRSLRVGPDAGVVTDALHYDASLILYAELAREGVPVAVARPAANHIKLEDLRALIGPRTRLVSVSLVSSDTGFEHDLAELCSIAHEQGALVYADIIQAAGAVPIDVRASGVDFCCCGTYKWLMGDFGTAFLYVRPDRLERLRRVDVGWRQVRHQESHVFPFEPPGPTGNDHPIGQDYELRNDAVGLFEVSTPGWGTLATAVGSLDYIQSLGVEAIARHRQPMIERLQQELPPRGFIPLTPTDSRSPIVAFAYRDAQKRWSQPLTAAGIQVSLYTHRIRISPSVYNDMADIERLLEALEA